jgi:hypothetical protein
MTPCAQVSAQLQAISDLFFPTSLFWQIRHEIVALQNIVTTFYAVEEI